MAALEIEVGMELGRFNNFPQWVNHAQMVYQEVYKDLGSKDVIALDSATPRRVMLRGLQFNKARDECTFPVVIYAIS